MTPDVNLLRPVSKADLDAVAARWRAGEQTKKHQLLVCAGAGCVSSGCHAVKHALLAAIKDAQRRAQDRAAEEMARLTREMGLPADMKMPF